MILTKEEFKERFAYTDLPSVHRLIRSGKIDVREDGTIDTNGTEKNKEFCLRRDEKLQKAKKKSQKKEKTPKNAKTLDQLSLDIKLMNSKLEESQRRAELLNIKAQKEKGELVETDVLSQCVKLTFDSMIKSLVEIPNIYANEIIGIVKADDYNSREVLVEYLTQKITSCIKTGLDNAKTAAKKYYEN